MKRVYAEIRAAGGEVIAISFSKPERVAAVLRASPLPFPTLCDPEFTSYRAFGLGRTTWLDILHPSVLLRFGGTMLRGWLPTRPTKGDDVLQLGGNFVLDRQRRITYAYRSREPMDRPRPEALLEAARSAARS